MPKELVRFESGIRWCQTVIRPGLAGPETEMYFEIAGDPFSVSLESIPERDFLHGVAGAHCLAVYEFSSAERGWVEPGRFQVRINDDDDGAEATAIADHVRWGPVSPA